MNCSYCGKNFWFKFRLRNHLELCDMKRFKERVERMKEEEKKTEAKEACSLCGVFIPLALMAHHKDHDCPKRPIRTERAEPIRETYSPPPTHHHHDDDDEPSRSSSWDSGSSGGGSDFGGGGGFGGGDSGGGGGEGGF